MKYNNGRLQSRPLFDLQATNMADILNAGKSGMWQKFLW
jgi:hypothetical protein